jgi:hypothetical protein
MKISLIDSHFSHVPCSSGPWQTLDKFEWDRINCDNDIIFLTDSSLQLVDNFSNKIKIGWLIESPEITKSAYDYIITNYYKFDIIFTHSKHLIGISEKFKFAPIGGCWIWNSEISIPLKTKNISIISSAKRDTFGHTLRHKIVNDFSKYFSIDLYGYGYNAIKDKSQALLNYRYSIVVENCREDFYFTEKLIDCFATGTIPIYWGCPSIGEFFDIDGILTFSSLEELEKILNNVSENDYNLRIKSVKNNFELSKKYFLSEHFIFDNYIKFL